MSKGNREKHVVSQNKGKSKWNIIKKKKKIFKRRLKTTVMDKLNRVNHLKWGRTGHMLRCTTKKYRVREMTLIFLFKYIYY